MTHKQHSALLGFSAIDSMKLFSKLRHVVILGRIITTSSHQRCTHVQLDVLQILIAQVVLRIIGKTLQASHDSRILLTRNNLQ